MKKKIIASIAVILAALIMLGLFGSRSEKGTITEFVDDAVIITLEDENTVLRIENYHTYIPTGEQWSIGDQVKIRHGLFNDLRILSITAGDSHKLIIE